MWIGIGVCDWEIGSGAGILGNGMACSKPGFWFWSSFCRLCFCFGFCFDFNLWFWFTPLFVCCQQNVFTPTWPGEDFFWAFSSLVWFIRCFSAGSSKNAKGGGGTVGRLTWYLVELSAYLSISLFVLIKIRTLINRQGPLRKLVKCSWVSL